MLKYEFVFSDNPSKVLERVREEKQNYIKNLIIQSSKTLENKLHTNTESILRKICPVQPLPQSAIELNASGKIVQICGGSHWSKRNQHYV